METRLVTNGSVLRSLFHNLLESAREVRIAVAWAGNPSDEIQQALWKVRRKVKRLVVGSSLFYTDPLFLEKWQGHKGFRVICETDEMFHPKLYLFLGSRTSQLIVGSGNLTTAAFGTNYEAVASIRSSNEVTRDALAYIEQLFRMARPTHGALWRRWLAHYKAARERVPLPRAVRPPERVSYGSGARPRNWQELREWSFQEYFRRLRLRRDRGATLIEWLTFIEDRRRRWSSAGWIIGRLPRRERPLLAGAAHARDEDSGILGFIGLGYFQQAIAKNPGRIDRALGHIPVKGEVTEEAWLAFQELYQHAFRKAAVGSATRLLAIRRPDVFFSANMGSIPKLAQALKVSQASMKQWSGYWEAVKWIQQCPWARMNDQAGTLAKRCWSARVALLDVLMYLAV